MPADEAADTFLILSDRMGQAQERLIDLGDPPEALTDVVRLVDRAMSQQEEAFAIASRGSRAMDVDLLNEATLLIQESTAFIGEAGRLLSEVLESGACY